MCGTVVKTIGRVRGYDVVILHAVKAAGGYIFTGLDETDNTMAVAKFTIALRKSSLDELIAFLKKVRAEMSKTRGQ